MFLILTLNKEMPAGLFSFFLPTPCHAAAVPLCMDRMSIEKSKSEVLDTKERDYER